MSEKVFAVFMDENTPLEERAERLVKAMQSQSFFDDIEDKDVVAVKTHFGETPKTGHPKPLLLKALGQAIKEQGGRPFLTETSTLYRGNRTDAVSHLSHAHNQGFTMEATGMPIVMADGLFGDNEVDIPIEGRMYKSIKVAAEIPKVQWLFLVSHFTGHLAAGFGAALKNLGMGCTSRRGKMLQHSTAKPKIKKKKCTLCGVCETWCPEDAISLNDETAVIDQDTCIGCGQCLAVCRFDAVAYNWSTTYEDLQKKIVEHALGVVAAVKGNGLYVNMLTDISKDCDCLTEYEKVTGDIGFLFSRDSVALDAASLDLVEERSGKKLSELCFDIPYRFQVDYAREIGFGSADYQLVPLEI